MVTKQLSIAIAISICIGSGVAFKTFAAAPTSVTRIDFDRVFADATRQSQSPCVDRARKSDRLPTFELPWLGPGAIPSLGGVVGRCDA
jgi:hypothetical protein